MWGYWAIERKVNQFKEMSKLKWIPVYFLHSSVKCLIMDLPYIFNSSIILGLISNLFVQLGHWKGFQESFRRGVGNIQQGQPCVGSFSNTALCDLFGPSLDQYDLQG